MKKSIYKHIFLAIFSLFFIISCSANNSNCSKSTCCKKGEAKKACSKDSGKGCCKKGEAKKACSASCQKGCCKK